MTNDPDDRTARYLLRRNAVALLCWLLGLREDQLHFERWLDTRRLPWPGDPERVCDTVAWVLDLARAGLPWAVVVEFRTRPDPEMFGRLLVYLAAAQLLPGLGRTGRYAVVACRCDEFREAFASGRGRR